MAWAERVGKVRISALFDTCRGVAFWYPFFLLMKSVIMGIVIAAVLSKVRRELACWTDQMIPGGSEHVA